MYVYIYCKHVRMGIWYGYKGPEQFSPQIHIITLIENRNNPFILTAYSIILK